MFTSVAHSCQCSSYKHIKEIQCPVTILDFYYEKMPDSEKIASEYCNELGKFQYIVIWLTRAVIMEYGIRCNLNWKFC